MNAARQHWRLRALIPRECTTCQPTDLPLCCTPSTSPWEGGSNSASVLKQTLPPLQKRPATMPGLATLSMGVMGLMRMAFLHENLQPKALVLSRHHSSVVLTGSQRVPLTLKMSNSRVKQKGIQTQRWKINLQSLFLHVSDELSQNTMWEFPTAKGSQSLPRHLKEDLQCCLPHFLPALPRVY